MKASWLLGGVVFAGSMTLASVVSAQEESDHDAMVRHFAVGYLGIAGVPIGNSQGGNDGGITAPIIGMRYWFTPLLGIDAGLGLGMEGGKDEVGPDETDIPSATAFALHAGVPLALANTGHFSFQVVPELNLGFASQKVEVDPDEVKNRGFLFNLGARVGGEVHFGFIHIPNLSLQGSVGLLYEATTVKTEGGAGAPDTDTKYTRNRFGTATYEDPWDLFAGSITAFYYF